MTQTPTQSNEMPTGTHPESQMLDEKVLEAALALASTPGRKLLPCPFCGEADQLYPGYRWPGPGVPHSVDCLGCGIDFIPREGVDAIAAWNRRAYIASQEAVAPSEEPVAWGRRVEWAEKFLGAYADGDRQKLLGGYDFHAAVRHLAGASQQIASPAVAPSADGFNRADDYAVLSSAGQGPTPFMLVRGSRLVGNYESVDDAKAAAQADFNARILSSIIPATKGGETVEQIAESIWQTTLDAICDAPAPLATFTISIFEDRSTLHVNAASGTAPDELLAKARATLDGEAADLAKCPFHIPSEIDPVAFEAARNSFVMAEHRRGNITRKVLTAYIAALSQGIDTEVKP